MTRLERPVRTTFLVAPLAAAGLYAQPAAAQSFEEIRAELRRGLADAGIGDTVQGLTGFAALPGVSAANFDIDSDTEGASDFTATKFVLPITHEFDGARIGGHPLYGELTLGFLGADTQVNDLFGTTSLAADADTEVHAYSAVGGIGLTFQLGSATTLRPLLLAGYSYIEERSRFAGPGAALLDELTDGFAFNLHTNVALVGAALQLDHRRELGGGIRFAGNLRYNQIHADSFAASDDILETSSDFGVLTAYGQFSGPVHLQILGRDLRWIAFAANSSFPGNASRALGVDYFLELGGGVEIVDGSVIEGIEGVSLRGSVLSGDGVAGWSVGAKLEF